MTRTPGRASTCRCTGSSSGGPGPGPWPGRNPAASGGRRRIAGHAHVLGPSPDVTRPGAELRNFPVTWPLGQIVAELNQWQPTLLGRVSLGLASAVRRGPVRPAADHPPAHPAPVGAPCWKPGPASKKPGVSPCTTSGSARKGASAATCGAGQGLHLSEDLVIIEPVDAACGAVPAGSCQPRSDPDQPVQPGPSAHPLRTHRPSVPPQRAVSLRRRAGPHPGSARAAQDLFSGDGPGLQVDPHASRSVLGAGARSSSSTRSARPPLALTSRW